MNGELAIEVLAEFERLSADDKNLLLTGLKNHYGKPISFSLDELSEMDQKKLETIKSIIGGIHLTREHVPNMLTAYENLKDKDLPSRISFGRLNQSANDED